MTSNLEKKLEALIVFLGLEATENVVNQESIDYQIACNYPPVDEREIEYIITSRENADE